MNPLRFVVTVGLLLGALLGWQREASAYSGYVSGTVQLWNKNGNYCPSTTDCTGAYYPQSLYNTTVPHRNAIIQVYQGSSLLGQSTTDINGSFVIYWSSSTLPTSAFVDWFAEQKDGRFNIENPSGQRTNNATSTFALTNGTTSSSPQNIGTWYTGSSASPDSYTNTYWAAEIEWRRTFNLVGALQTGYTNVEIRGFADTISGSGWGYCPTSCAHDSGKQIQLDSHAALAIQGRILHESGHIANYVVKPFKNGGNYCWPNTSAPDFDGTSPCYWAEYNDPEWGAAAFEEAMATYAGNVTLWYPNAAHPTTCLSQGACPDTSATQLELSDYAHTTNNCQSDSTSRPESRWPISAERFLWDVYDANNDADGDTIQEGWDCFWCTYANLAYADGTGTYQIDEPWNSDYSAIDNYDGRGSLSYDSNYTLHYKAIGALRTDNCSPK